MKKTLAALIIIIALILPTIGRADSVASPSKSTVSALPTSVFADGSTTSTIGVALMNAENGIPVPGTPGGGKVVTLVSSRGAIDTISAASDYTLTFSNWIFFTVKSSTIGTSVFTATDTSDGVTILQTATVVFTGPAGKLAFTTQPPSVTQAGVAMTPQVVVQIEDLSGNAVPQSGTLVTLSGPNGLSSGTTATTDANGRAHFGNLVITNVGSALTLTARANGLADGTSAAFAITPGAPGKIVFAAEPPSTIAAGAPMAPLVVQIEDLYGNAVPQSGWLIFLGGPLAEVYTYTDANGQATFDDTTLDQAGSGLTLYADETVHGLGVVYSTPFTVTAETAFDLQLVFSTEPPASTQGGLPMAAFTVQLEDFYGNAILQSGTLVTLSGPSGLESGITATTDANGLATFANTSITTPGSGLTLIATAAGYNNGTSSSFIITPGSTYSLSATSAIELPSAGSGSVVLTVTPNSGPWTAGANASWLHVSSPSGTGTATVGFSFDANSTRTTRSGTLTIGAQTFSVTQVGSAYAAAGAVGALISGLVTPSGVAVDSAGNVYIADSGAQTIYEWLASSGTIDILVSSGLTDPTGLAVDSAGDLFIADGTGNQVYELPSGGSLTLLPTTTSLNDPTGVTVDSAGDLFIADSGDGTIYELPYPPYNGGTPVPPTILATGLNAPADVAVDSSGNLFIADSGDATLYELSYPYGGAPVPLTTNPALITPTGVAVDSSGNLFISDSGANAIYELPYPYTAGILTLLSSDPNGVAVDSADNVYFSDSNLNSVEEMQNVFVDTTPISEGAAAGSDTLPAVTPATANLSGVFMPLSDQSWLTIATPVNGVVGFSFTANNGPNRIANITLFGQAIPIVQAGIVTTLPELTGIQMSGNGVIQFTFTNVPNGSFTVLTSTSLSLPLSEWTVAGQPQSISPGVFQFTSQPTSDQQRYYSVRSP